MKSEERFEQAVHAVREEPIDPRTLAAAGERVWARLSNEMAATGADTPAAESDASSHLILGCAGFRDLMPAYLAGALTDAKRVLLEDHTRECIACRRALTAARQGKPSTRAAAEVTSISSRRAERGSVRTWARAASLAGIALLSGFLVRQAGVGYLGAAPTFTVRTISGELAVVSAGEVRPAVAGERIGGSQTVRTTEGSGAVLELADGSRIELAERSELGLGRRWDGTILELERGSLIVEAAKQRRGHLYVDSGDCRVSVVGTIFSVNHGAKGSRISVIEGEVHVREGAELAVLRPGEQFASGHRLASVAVADEIAWSRDAARYRERLAALHDLGRELDRALTPESARTSTRLLDLVPATTGIYVALPNLSASLGSAWQLVEQRVAENPVLAEWWNGHFSNPEDEAAIAQAVSELERFGGSLGSEIVVAFDLAAGSSGSGAAEDSPLLLAEVQNPAEFSSLLDEEIARLNALPEPSGNPPAAGLRLRRIADPSAAVSEEGALFVWLTDDLLLAAPSAATLAAIQAELASGARPFVGTGLHSRLAAIYAGGAEWLLGVDLETLVARGLAEHQAVGGHSSPDQVLAGLGLADAQYLVLDSRNDDGESQSRAQLSFAHDREGLASWLAEPAPVGALEFVSPNAHLAVGGVLKEPAEMLDDLLNLVASAQTEGEPSPLQGLAQLENEHGISLRADLAATLGGDFAFAFDGPWLPTPSWKLVLEVNDAGRLQSTLERLVAEWNREAATAPGGPRPNFALTQEAVGDRVYFDLATTAGAELAHFLFADGYLVVGPSRALLAEALAQRDAGVTLAGSAQFLDLLPLDRENNYSAFVYQNLAGAVGALGEFLSSRGEMPAAAREQLNALAGTGGATLAVAYAESRDITFATRGARGPLGLSFESLLALAGIFDDETGAGSESELVETAQGPQA